MEVSRIEIQERNKEEILPEYSSYFPYLMSVAETERYSNGLIPWHWHNAVELFYIQSGELEYTTPGKKLRFPAGTGGLVNSGVLHTTKTCTKEQRNIQSLHLFDPMFLVDAPGGRLAETYILPVLSSGFEILPLLGENETEQQILTRLRESFLLDSACPGYEMLLRNRLSELWISLMGCLAGEETGGFSTASDEKLKKMMVFVHDHYAEKITAADMGKSAYLSERMCYRLFQSHLHCSPGQYLNGYRLRMAEKLLQEGACSITETAMRCGFGSSSHFGTLFSEKNGCTPRQYMEKCQNPEKPWHRADSE